MGLTIHFMGQLKSSRHFDQVISLGEAFAKRKNTEIFKLVSHNQSLIRVKNGKVSHYRRS